MSSPKPKKIKLSSDDISSSYYTDDDGKHDRILLVENAKFYVQSDKLMDCAEYFRVMLSSDFIEKGKETIELKEFKIEQIKMLLDGIFKLDEVKVDHYNIKEVVELFVYFQAIDSLIDLLKKNEVFERQPPGDLLKLAEQFGVKEMKDSVEEWFVAFIGERYETKDRLPKKKQRADDFRWDDMALDGLHLAEKYQLKELMAKIDSSLAFEYNHTAHFASVEDEHLQMLNRYRLVKLTEAIEVYAIKRFAREHKVVMKKYLLATKKVPMEKLKEVVENHFIGKFEEEPLHYPAHFNDYLKICKEFDFQRFKEHLRNYLEIDYNREEDHANRTILSKQKIVELASTFGLEPIRGEEQARLIASYNQNKEDYETFVKKLAKYDFPELKEIVEEYLVNEFLTGYKLYDQIEEFCKYIKECKMEKLKDALENHFLAEFLTKHCFYNIKYAFECNMEKFKTAISSFLASSAFDDPLLMTARYWILALPDEYHKFILSSMIKEPTVKKEEPSSSGVFQ